jgi:hypothetical protein
MKPKAARPCPHRNTSFVPLTEQHFGLARRLARCKFVKDRGGLIRQTINFEEPGGFPRRARMLCGIFSVIRLQRSGCREAKGKLTMRSLLMLVAICFSATAFAQSAPPKVGNKSLVQVKPKEPMGCKLVGSVRGTKLWAGDCVGSELRGSTTMTETQASPEQATGAITPDQKE